MKKRMLSVLLSAMLVIATICVSNMPSRAVEPEDEVTQDETVTTEVLCNSEETEEELSGEVTETTAEELTEETTETDKKTSENITSTETIVDEENSEPQADAINEAGDEKNGQENEDGITETDAVDFDADTETAGDIENDEMSVENSNEDMMLPDEETTEEVQEEITEEMLDGAEVDKLENVEFYFGKAIWDSGRKKEYSIGISVRNNNEFDVYLSCLKSYVIDEKGNKYNVPVFVESYAPDKIDITNDINGYSGYNNESVLTDKGVCIPPKTAGEGGPSKSYTLNYTIPVELEGNITFYMYAETVKLDDISGKVISLCNDSGNYSVYECVTNAENSNYSILEYVRAELGNVDIDVYYDGNHLTAGAERNFYIQISNNNDFDIWLKCIMSKWAYENYDSEDELIKNMQIIHPDGRNMTNLRGRGDAGYSALFDEIEGGSVIKAGQTATYRVNCMLSSDSSEKTQTIDFHIDVHSVYAGVYCCYCEFNPLNNDTPTVSIDKKDENVPDIKLDDKACDNLINSIFTKNEINSGKHLKVDLIVAAVSEAGVEQSELDAIKVAAKKRKIAVILDMNLVRLIDGIVSGNVNELDKEITMTIDVPKEFQAANRKFSIIRLHDGIAEELPDLDDNPNTVTFTTGKFSLYALIYEDAAITPVKDTDKTQQTASPNTGDSIPVATLPIVMLTTIVLAVLCIRKMKKDNM